MFTRFNGKRKAISLGLNWSAREGFKGFALMELLIIISVIGVLIGITLVNGSAVRAKARDTQRISDIANIKSALELYFLENGFFPFQDDGGIAIGSDGYSSLPQGSAPGEGKWWVLENALAPYLNDLPDDPLNTWDGSLDPFPFTDTYSYWYFPDAEGVDYDLVAHFETKNALRCEIKGWQKHINPTCGESWCDDPTEAISTSEFRKDLYSVPHALFLCP
jgi:type II secretory pathway pseudopilin PulG